MVYQVGENIVVYQGMTNTTLLFLITARVLLAGFSSLQQLDGRFETEFFQLVHFLKV